MRRSGLMMTPYMRISGATSLIALLSACGASHQSGESVHVDEVAEVVALESGQSFGLVSGGAGGVAFAVWDGASVASYLSSGSSNMSGRWDGHGFPSLTVLPEAGLLWVSRRELDARCEVSRGAPPRDAFVVQADDIGCTKTRAYPSTTGFIALLGASSVSGSSAVWIVDESGVVVERSGIAGSHLGSLSDSFVAVDGADVVRYEMMGGVPEEVARWPDQGADWAISPDDDTLWIVQSESGTRNLSVDLVRGTVELSKRLGLVGGGAAASCAPCIDGLFVVGVASDWSEGRVVYVYLVENQIRVRPLVRWTFGGSSRQSRVTCSCDGEEARLYWTESAPEGEILATGLVER